MSHYSPGLYRCKITAQGFGKSDNKKTPFFWLETLPLEGRGQDGRKFPIADGYRRTVKLWLTSRTIDRVAKRLRELGWRGDDWMQLDPTTSGHHSFVDQEVILRCAHETNQQTGRTYDRFEFPLEGGSTVLQDHDSTVARTVSDLFGAALRERTAAVTPQEVRDVESTPDDIPF